MLEEIVSGVIKKIKVKKEVICIFCNGSGVKDSSSVKICMICCGVGYVCQVKNIFFGQMQIIVICFICNGLGQQVMVKCMICGGDGWMYGEEIMEIEILVGVEEGMQLFLWGKGNVGVKGGFVGDFLINIEEKLYDYL